MNSVQRFPWGRMDWLANSELGPTQEVSVAKMVLSPKSRGERHRHDDCEEVLIVQKGTVVLECAGTERSASSGEALIVSRGIPHTVSNPGEDLLELLLVYGSASRSYVSDDFTESA